QRRYRRPRRLPPHGQPRLGGCISTSLITPIEHYLIHSRERRWNRDCPHHSSLYSNLAPSFPRRRESRTPRHSGSLLARAPTQSDFFRVVLCFSWLLKNRKTGT